MQKCETQNREYAKSLGAEVWTGREEKAAGWAWVGEEYWRVQSHLTLDATFVEIRVGGQMGGQSPSKLRRLHALKTRRGQPPL